MHSCKKNIYAERNENAKNCKMHRTIGGRRRRRRCCCYCCTSFMNRPMLWCTTRTVNFFVIFASMLFFAFFRFFLFSFCCKTVDIYSEHSDRDGGKFTVSSFDCSVSFMLSNTFVASVHWFTHFSHRLHRPTQCVLRNFIC